MVNVCGFQLFFAQFQTLKLCKKMLNAANIYPFGIKSTKCKYIDTSFINLYNIHIRTKLDATQTILDLPSSLNAARHSYSKETSCMAAQTALLPQSSSEGRR